MNKPLLLIFITLFYSQGNTQSVLNGSFETSTAPANCNYNITNAAYNNYIANSEAFGVYEAIDVVINGCFVNNIPDGTFGVSLANNPGNNMEGEAISLSLSSPLTVGSAYQIDFQATAVQYATVTQGDLLIGVSTSGSNFGTIIDTASTVENVWNPYSFTFTADSPSSHITVMPVPGISSWNCVDAFSIIEVCSATYGTDVMTACDSYTWIDGNTYSASNDTATWTLTNAGGCDSIVTLNLTITPFPDVNVTQSGTTLTVNQSGVNYQWCQCGPWGPVPIQGETTQSYTPLFTGTYAVIVNSNGCIDTSSCILIDFTGMEELFQKEKELVKIIDFTGRETKFKPNTPLIFIYSDGTRERVMKIEE